MIDHPNKKSAQVELARAIQTGLVTRGPCEVCGSNDTDGHHSDYSKPLSVRWLCRSHHMQVHSTMKTRRKKADVPVGSIKLDPPAFERLALIKKRTGKTYSGIISALLSAYERMTDSERAQIMFNDTKALSPAGSPPG